MARKDRKPDGRRFNDGERQGAQKSGRERTHFKKGHPGYRNGAPNKTTRIMKDAMILAAEQVGDLSGINPKNLSKEGIERGTDGLVGYLRWAAKCEPKSFLSLLGRLLPMQAKVDSFTKTVYHSVAEIKHDISRRGLNLKAFGQLLLDAHQTKKGEFDAGTTDGDGADAA